MLSRTHMTIACRGVLLVAVVSLAHGCTNGNVVVGHIPPDTFQFTTVLEYDGDGPGGWQVAQVGVLLGRLSTMFPRTAVCGIEVGMPVVNTQQGYIPESLAQRESAIAADKAAHELLGQRKRPTATACQLFRERMQHYLADEIEGTIAGAKVTGFKAWNGRDLPRRTFPARRGHR